mmetsp:Transcript_56189/g.122893  ORF Transcript_56189/g.122893 Transcript_56189/m.122893 type:complete len:204 (-) Transcript_56189:764-1375(-)
MVRLQHLGIHVEGQFNLQRFGDDMQEFDGFRGEVSRDGVLGVAAHALGDHFGHVILLQISLQCRQLPRTAPSDDVLLGEARGEDAQHDQGDDENGAPHGHREEPLNGRGRRDFVHATGELRKRPVEGGQVLGIHSLSVVAQDLDPGAVRGVSRPYGKPEAPSEVRNRKQNDEDFAHLQQRAQRLRLDALCDVGHDLLHTHQAQ